MQKLKEIVFVPSSDEFIEKYNDSDRTLVKNISNLSENFAIAILELCSKTKIFQKRINTNVYLKDWSYRTNFKGVKNFYSIKKLTKNKKFLTGYYICDSFEDLAKIKINTKSNLNKRLDILSKIVKDSHGNPFLVVSTEPVKNCTNHESVLICISLYDPRVVYITKYSYLVKWNKKLESAWSNPHEESNFAKTKFTRDTNDSCSLSEIFEMGEAQENVNKNLNSLFEIVSDNINDGKVCNVYKTKEGNIVVNNYYK